MTEGGRLLEKFLIEKISKLNTEIQHLEDEIGAFNRMLRKLRGAKPRRQRRRRSVSDGSSPKVRR
jgi:hypothetical protein